VLAYTFWVLYNFSMANVADKKYENTILYLCKALGGTLHGKKKLAKLLYYVDFDRYEYNESTRTITGDTYQAWKMGPVPKHYTEVIAKLAKEGRLLTSQAEGPDAYLPTEVYSASVEPDMSVFDEADKLILQRVVKNYGGLTGKQLEELTHSEAPFIATEQSQDIAFDLAFYRGTDFSDAMTTT
jgi:uncharacterized phage-associated protein